MNLSLLYIALKISQQALNRNQKSINLHSKMRHLTLQEHLEQLNRWKTLRYSQMQTKPLKKSESIKYFYLRAYI